jgi:hypothetical protein
MGEIRLTRVDPTLPCTAAVLHPEWALEERARLDCARHRSLAGRLSTARWELYAEFRLPLKHVPGDVAALLRDWWRQGAALALTLDTSHPRATVVCAIASATQPLGERGAPDAERWSGVLTLAGRGPGWRAGQPFILDDPLSGRLDQPLLTLME